MEQNLLPNGNLSTHRHLLASEADIFASHICTAESGVPKCHPLQAASFRNFQKTVGAGSLQIHSSWSLLFSSLLFLPRAAELAYLSPQALSLSPTCYPIWRNGQPFLKLGTDGAVAPHPARKWTTALPDLEVKWTTCRVRVAGMSA